MKRPADWFESERGGWGCSAVLVDVRARSEYDVGFVHGSVSVPLYRLIEGWGWAANLRRAAFAFFGSMGSELDPQWVTQMESTVRKGAENPTQPLAVRVRAKLGEVEPSADP